MASTIARANRGEDAVRVPLDIAALVAPHKKKHGRLSLRIERLPQKARFSRGSRNNDGSWSLATDELDDLVYLLDKDIARAHTLAIRVISLAGGDTLAVIEQQVTPGAEAPAPASSGETNDGTDAQVQALRAQLAEMKVTLSARDAELALRIPEKAAVPARNTDAEIAAAREEMQVEFAERLAAVGAQAAAELAQQRKALTDELTARVATLTAAAQKEVAEAKTILQRHGEEALTAAKAAWASEEAARLAVAEARWREDGAKAVAAARAEGEVARSHSVGGEIEALRNTLKREAQEALAKAEAAWRAAEGERLGAAQAKWRATADAEIAAARAEGDTRDKLASGRIDAFRNALRHEAEEGLAKAEAAWRAAESERLAAAQAQWRAEAAAASGDASATEIEMLRATLEREAQEALATAAENWKISEAVRLNAAHAEWQQAADKALAETRAQMAAVRDDSQENEALREDMIALQARLAEREAALAKTQKAHEALREADRAEARETLAKAEAKWKGEEAARLHAAQTQWRAETEKAVAAASAAAVSFTPVAAPETADAAANVELRERVSVLETMLGEREAALAEAQDIIEQQTKAAQQRPAKSRKAEESERMAAVEAEWRAEYGNALAEARARYEAAEAALAQVRIKTKDGGRTSQELASTRAALAAREKELADLRAMVAPLDGMGESIVPATAEEAAPKPAQFSRGFIGAVIAAACALALAIVFYPSIEAMVFGAPKPAVQTAPAAKADERLAPVAVDERKAMTLREVNLRAEPLPSAKVVATVSRGSEVVVLQTEDKWSQVRFNGAKAIQGWVLQSTLKDIPTPAAPGK